MQAAELNFEHHFRLLVPFTGENFNLKGLAEPELQSEGINVYFTDQTVKYQITI